MRKLPTIITTIITILAVTLGSLAVTSAPAGAESSTRSASTRSASTDFVAKANALRTSRGLAPLTVDTALTSSSQTWAQHMADTATLAHDPALGSAVTGWTKIGENVGTGPDVNRIFDAFVNSPGHLANLLDPAYTHIGIATVTDTNGTLWTTHRFITKAAPAPAPAPVITTPTPAPAPAPAPAPVLTTPAPAPAPAPIVTAPAPAPAPAPIVTAPAPAPAPAPVEATETEAKTPAGKPSAEASQVGQVIGALRALDA